MRRRTEGLWQRRGVRIAVLGAAILAGAGASGLSAEVDNVLDGGIYGALPLKDPATGRVVGHYCTATHCYSRDSGDKYRFCCIH